MDTQRFPVPSLLKVTLGHFVFGLFSDDNTEGRSLHYETGRNEVKNYHIHITINTPKQIHMLKTTFYSRTIFTSIFLRLNYFGDKSIEYFYSTFCKLY